MTISEAHPLLNPDLANDAPDAFRHLYRRYLLLRENQGQYNEFLNRIFNPAGDSRSLEANLATAAYYLNETVGYMGELLAMLPAELRAQVVPKPEVMGCPDILELFNLIFCSGDRRVSFEAQRKLYLSKLFFDVDHCWEVQRGTEHKEYFESILEKALFSHTVTRRKIDICCRLREDGESIEYSVGKKDPEQECWTFDTREIELLHDGRPVRFHLYFYAARFKREIVAFTSDPGRDHYRIAANEIWPGLTRRRSASIVSKMIRKGENDPRWIEDLIGVMFIVENLLELENLKEMLYDLFGGAFRVKNVVDTLTRPEDRSLLNPWSGPGYEVYKAEVDLLYNPERNRFPMPYFFTVELQMYTLESYLRTIHSAHYASHEAFKQRQFLHGLFPHLFPERIYGAETLRALAALLSGEPAAEGRP